MEEQVFYVAIMHEAIQPTIVESFKDSKDAQLYADIMARNKGLKYGVLAPVYEVNPQSKAQPTERL